MDVDMIKSSSSTAVDHHHHHHQSHYLDMMTIMMQMEKTSPEFCDPYQNTTPPTFLDMNFSDGPTVTQPDFASTTTAETAALLNNMNPVNASLPFLCGSGGGSGNPIQEPVTPPPFQPNAALSGGRIFKTGGAIAVPNPYEKRNSMAAMREMIFRIAAMQPIHIDPESIKPPKRRNVKISKDPQSVAARHRRERISERIRILQRLVPGGTKMDTASMLDEAIHYVKFLKKQVQTLEQAGANRPATAAVGFPGTHLGNLNYSAFFKACQPTNSPMPDQSLRMLR